MPSNSAVHALHSCILPLLLKWVIDLDFYTIGSWGLRKFWGKYYLSGRDNTDMKVIKLIVIP